MGLRVQVALSYVQTGAQVGRRAAQEALASYRKWTGAQAKGGWLTLTPAMLEATWMALGWLMDQGMVQPPEVAPSVLVPAFLLDLPDRRRGKVSCGCPAHAEGDRDPSLLFDLERGVATCMVSREVFILQEDPEGTWACRIARAVEFDPEDLQSIMVGRVPGEDQGTVTKDTPPGREPPPEEPTPTPFTRELEKAGRPGPSPRCPGITSGRLWSCGLSQTLSKAKTREAWVRWQARRWGGEAGLSAAWSELAYRETGRTPRGWTPDRLVGVGWWRPTAISWMEGSSGRRWPILYLEEKGTGHVLFDIDHVDGLPVSPSPEMLSRILGAVTDFGILDAPAWVIRTSSSGLQVLVRLHRFRWDPQDFYRSQSIQRFLRFAGQRLVEAMGGGEVDASAFAPKRFGRAPGWRVKGSEIERAALWWADGDGTPEER